MKKSIAIIFIGIAVLNIIGLIYLISTNPDKLTNNSSHFIKKIGGALVFGAIGVYFLTNNSAKKG